MKGATLALRDILPDAAAETAQSEPLVYTFWKACAQADSLVDEAILCQSNTIKKIDARYMALRGKDTQPEAQTLTHAFKARFPQWAENYRKQAQSDTNMPPFSAEDQKKIEELTDHALKLQGEILDSKTVEKDRPALRQQAYQDLVEIRDLLPKKPNSGQNQQQQQQQNQQQQNKEQQQQEQKQEEQKQEQKQEEQQAQEKKEETPKDAQEVLRRALEREKEHENEKKRRQQRIPMSPSERDW
jgi:flagellar biosynthesis GTPase FlhF